jgi:DNA invertase Pin-like site-specific DNA recombinase
MLKIAFSYIRFSTPEQAKGDSHRRQLELSRAYAAKNGLTLDESLQPDRGISAFQGRNRTEGNLAAFLARVKDGTVAKGSALLVESLDRLSREEVEEALYAFLDIVRSGIDIHTLADGQVFRKGKMKTEQLMLSLFVMSRANEESLRKSERCGIAWSRKRHNANGKAAMSSRVSAWLKATKGKPIEVVPERAAIVRQIFDWAAAGIGQYQIADKLTAAKVRPWGPKRNDVLPRWSPAYVRDILASRAVLGEYQPMSKWTTKIDDDGNEVRVKLKRRQPDGPLVTDYYPQIIPTALWHKVQMARQDFAKAKFGESLHAGRSKFSTANLFRKMVWDVQNNAPMVFRKYEGHPCLVTTHRQSLRQHKIAYPLFEEVLLRFLRSADWRELAKEGLSPEGQKLLFVREKLAKELDAALKIRSRYEALLDDPESATDDRINKKYKAASKEVRRVQEAYNALDAEIVASRTGSELLAATKGIEIIRIDRHSDDGRNKLRLFLAQRIERIEITFKVTFLSAPDSNRTVANISPGEGQTLIRIIFKGGAERLAILKGKKLTALELSEYKPTS